MKIKRQKALCDANEDYIHQFAELGLKLLTQAQRK